jgi:hypothetical protein
MPHLDLVRTDQRDGCYGAGIGQAFAAGLGSASTLGHASIGKRDTPGADTPFRRLKRSEIVPVLCTS